MKINFKTKEAYCTFSEYNRLKEVLESTNVNINDFTIHVEESIVKESQSIDKILKDWEKQFLDEYDKRFPEFIDRKKEWENLIPKVKDIPNYWLHIKHKVNGD